MYVCAVSISSVIQRPESDACVYLYHCHVRLSVCLKGASLCMHVCTMCACVHVIHMFVCMLPWCVTIVCDVEFRNLDAVSNQVSRHLYLQVFIQHCKTKHVCKRIITRSTFPARLNRRTAYSCIHTYILIHMLLREHASDSYIPVVYNRLQERN